MVRVSTSSPSTTILALTLTLALGAFGGFLCFTILCFRFTFLDVGSAGGAGGLAHCLGGQLE